MPDIEFCKDKIYVISRDGTEFEYSFDEGSTLELSYTYDQEFHTYIGRVDHEDFSIDFYNDDRCMFIHSNEMTTHFAIRLTEYQAVHMCEYFQRGSYTEFKFLE